jgi:hypothetical protein
MSDASVPAGVKQASEGRDPREWSWVEPVVWNEWMLATLGNGVKGGKWFTGRLGKSLADHRRWPNAFFAEHGLYSLQGARVQASQSRRG